MTVNIYHQEGAAFRSKSSSVGVCSDPSSDKKLHFLLRSKELKYSNLQKNPNSDFFVLSHLSIHRETVFGFFT
jgi:hypothetical protein